MNTKPTMPVVAKARDDDTLQVLVALFAKAHQIDEDRVWLLVETGFTLGALAGFDIAVAAHKLERNRAISEPEPTA